MKRLVGATCLLLAVQAVASAQAVTGTWRGEYDSGVSGSGDAVRVTRRSAAVLKLEQRGDSVFGHWSPEPAPPGGKPVAVSGTLSGAILRLTTGTRDIPVTIDGKVVTRRTRTDWTGTVTADEISGTMAIYLGGTDDPPRRTWKVTRQGGG